MIKQILFDEKVSVGISEISDGNMRFFNGEENEVISNQKKLGELLDLDGDRIARVRTIYENRNGFTDYFEITDENKNEYAVSNFENMIPVSDGLITRLTNLGILLPLADCLGIVVFDEEHQVLGLLHAGRQNLEEFGPKKFINYLTQNFNCSAEKIKVFFSPYALNYQIFKLDNKTISEAAKEQLIEAGVLAENIVDSEIDTVGNEAFPSHSSGDKTNRFAIVVKQV